MSTTPHITALEDEISVLQERLEAAMAVRWPIDSEVRFRIQSNHVRPSTGIVMAHNGRFGTIAIRMASGHACRVTPSQILP